MAAKAPPAPKMPSAGQVKSAVSSVASATKAADSATAKVATLQAKLETAKPSQVASLQKQVAAAEKTAQAATAKVETAGANLNTLVQTAQTVAATTTSNASKVAAGEITGKAATTAVSQAKTATTNLTAINKTLATIKVPESVAKTVEKVKTDIAPLVSQTREVYFDAAISTATKRDTVKNLVITEAKLNLSDQGLKPAEINKEIKGLAKNLQTEAAIEADQTRNINNAIAANVTAVTSALKEKGATKKEINAAIKEVQNDGKELLSSYNKTAIKGSGTVEYFNPADQTIKTLADDNGKSIQPVNVNQGQLPRISVGIASDTLPTEVTNRANEIVKTAIDLSNKYKIPQIDVSGDVTKGLGINSLVKASLTKDPTTNLYSDKTDVGRLLNLSEKYISEGKTFTPDQIVDTNGKKLKLTSINQTGIDPQTGEQTKFAYAKVGDKYVSFKQNADGTYSGMGSTYIKVEEDDSFWNSTLGKIVKIGANFIPGGQIIGPLVNAYAAYETSGGDIGAALTAGATSVVAPKIGEFVSQGISNAISNQLAQSVSDGVISQNIATKVADSIAGAGTNIFIGKIVNPDADIGALAATGAATGYSKTGTSDLAKTVLGAGDKEAGARFIDSIVQNSNLTAAQVESAVTGAIGQGAVGVVTGNFDASKVALDAAATLGGGSAGNLIHDKILEYAPTMNYAANAGKLVADIGVQAGIKGQDVGLILTSAAPFIAGMADKMTAAEMQGTIAKDPSQLSESSRKIYDGYVNAGFSKEESLALASSTDPKFQSVAYGQQIGPSLAVLSPENQEKLRKLQIADPNDPPEVFERKVKEFDEQYDKIIQDEISLGEKGNLRQNADGSYTNISNGNIYYKNKDGNWQLDASSLDTSKTSTGTTTFTPAGDVATSAQDLNLKAIIGLGTNTPGAINQTLFGGGASTNFAFTDPDVFQFIVKDTLKEYALPENVVDVETWIKDQPPEIRQKISDTIETKVNQKIETKTDPIVNQKIETDPIEEIIKNAQAGGGGAPGGGGLPEGGGTPSGGAPTSGDAGTTDLYKYITSAPPLDTTVMDSNAKNAEIILQQYAQDPNISEYYIDLATKTLGDLGFEPSSESTNELAENMLRNDISNMFAGSPAPTETGGTGGETGDGTTGTTGTTGTGTEGTGTTGTGEAGAGGTGGGDGTGTGSGTGSGTGTGDGSGSGTGTGTGTGTGGTTPPGGTPVEIPKQPDVVAGIAGLLPSAKGPTTTAEPPPATAFYYGKPFSTQTQQISPTGELLQEMYQPLSVTTPGPELAATDETGENAITALIKSLLGEKGDVNDLLEILKG